MFFVLKKQVFTIVNMMQKSQENYFHVRIWWSEMVRFFKKKTKKTSKFSTRYTDQKMIFFKRCISCIVSWFLMRKNISQNRLENSNLLIFFWKKVYIIWFWVFFCHFLSKNHEKICEKRHQIRTYIWLACSKRVSSYVIC